MSPEELGFLKELQAACLKECEDFLNSFRENLSSLKDSPTDCIQRLQKIIHSMKGNLQAAAFLHFGEFIHQLETALEGIEKTIATLQAPIAEDDCRVLEFFVSNVLDAMESYLNELKSTGEDSEALRLKRLECLTTLACWKPSEPTSAATPITEAASEPAPEPTLAPAMKELEATVDLSLAVAEASEPAPRPPVSPAEHSATEPTGSGLFLLFQNRAQYFAIAIEHIVEVIKSQTLSPPPTQRKNLFGLLNLRGEVLPILKIEDLDFGEEVDNRYVVVAQLQELRFGFQVESVHQVVALDAKDFQAVSASGENADGKRKPRFCQLDGRTVSILSLNDVVAA